MGMQVYNMEDKEVWDKVVKGFVNHDVYYLSEYSKAFQIHGDGDPHLFFYEDDQMKAMNVVMKRDIANDRRFAGKVPPNAVFDAVTPYGYGGFLIEGDTNQNSLNKLKDEYERLCMKEGIVCEFVRFHPVLKNADMQSSLYHVFPMGKTVTMVLDSKEDIWNTLTSKNRNMIRKAEKSGVEIFWGRNPSLFEAFIPLYNQTMAKDEATDYYYFQKNFYESVHVDLKYHSLIFYAMYEGRIIAMAIIMFAGKQMHYHLSTTDVNYQHLAPGNLLLFEAACWGSENGFETFHLGGGYGCQEDSLYKFKSAFNKKSNTNYAIGKKIFNQAKYDELVKIRNQEAKSAVNTSFFPAYRQ